MQVLDPGHKYLVQTIDGDESQILTFLKRKGEKYPGNTSSYSGTLIQDVLRCCIDRIKYVDNQDPHPFNLIIKSMLRGVIFLLELRAAERHNKKLSVLYCVDRIETFPTKQDGHLYW